MSEKNWNQPKYQRINSVELNGDFINVKFEDGSIVVIDRQSLLPPNTLNANWDAMQFNAYEIIVPTSLDDIEIPWSTIRLLGDAKFAAHWSQMAEEQSTDIGERLRALRKSRNLTSKDVALRAGLSPQSLSRIEKGHHDVVFSTLQKILAAMGCTLQDLASVQTTPHHLDALIKRLDEAGIKKEWLLKRILPSEYIQRLHEYDDSSLTALIAAEVSKIYKWPVDLITGTSGLALSKSAIQFAKFKTGSRVNEKQVSAYTLYAHFLSLLVIQSTEHISIKPVPEATEEIKNQIAVNYGALNFENTLRYIWDRGIPVIPLMDDGVFHGACWKISDRSVIVLKQTTKYQGRWLYDLIHELGHVVKHLKNNSQGIVEDNEISPFDNSDEEREANEFAEALIFSGQAEYFAETAVERARNKVENLKSAVIQLGSDEHIPVDLLANYLAFRLSLTNNINWWGAANNLQVTEPHPYDLAKKMFFEKVSLGSLSQEDQGLILRAFD